MPPPTKVRALGVEHLDMRGQCGEGERVEREQVLSVLGLAVRLNHLAVDDDAGRADGEDSGVEVEQVSASARQLAAPHARGRFEHPQREERSPSYLAKSSKSLTLKVASGNPCARQHAAIQLSFVGRGRPRRRAAAEIAPHVREVASSESKTTTRLSQCSSSPRVRGPQLRIAAHCHNSPTVTNVTHNVAPVSRAASGPLS